jgi:hypothetical protein
MVGLAGAGALEGAGEAVRVAGRDHDDGFGRAGRVAPDISVLTVIGARLW